MDIETSEAIDVLRLDIRQVEATLDAKIGQAESSLLTEMREIREETKRHTDVLFETLRDEFRLVAEAIVALSAKVDRFFRPNGRS